jgi:hypothetical protein
VEPVKLACCAIAVLCALAAVPGVGDAASDPLCTGAYGHVRARSGPPLRFGIDPGLAGSAGNVQLRAVPDDPVRDLTAVRALRPRGRTLVVRLNRLFWSDGDRGIARFRRLALRYSSAGFEVEVQVRYHPGPGRAGDIVAWTRYVRHVVDTLGEIRGVVAMTITNEVNIAFSPNTSDGAYSRAPAALIAGIEAGHDEAVRRRLRALRFGFTYAYRFVPAQDAAFFAYLGAHGGPAFRRALGFVGLDFYPGSIYPPVIKPGNTYAAELAQAAGVLRRCMLEHARIGPRVPIWITENGVPTGALSDAQQAAALRQLVSAANAYSGTFGITDYRWFNLRDSIAGQSANPLTFATFGLLHANYTRKPGFGVYRRLIASLGES